LYGWENEVSYIKGSIETEAVFDQRVKDSIRTEERERESERNGHETERSCIIRSLIIRTIFQILLG
jgi:hypothetical protein